MIEVPMFETLASFWLTEHLFGATWTPERGEMGYDRIINEFRKPFPTSDGYICALPYTDKHWVAFFEIASARTLRPTDLLTAMNERSISMSFIRSLVRCLNIEPRPIGWKCSTRLTFRLCLCVP